MAEATFRHRGLERDAGVAEPEIITVPEWARRVACSKETAYKAARRGEIPGCFGIGRLLRVNWTAFIRATDPSTPHQLADELGSVPVPPLDHVGVHPQGRRRVSVA
jgi:excisionase family DNA binding protein